ncbi:hypothetical protein D3C84_921400 [compost metagenome]
MPPQFIRVPARMKKGIASREKLSRPVAIFWPTTARMVSIGSIIMPEARVARPMEKEMGTPANTNTKKEPNMTRAMVQSIRCSPLRGQDRGWAPDCRTGSPA